ncbi:MAG: histidine ammonia-lyase [Gammaproteobacteria bacterium]|nr:histidine ammonia-lyase [Gammaproteobacteria bacterium]
MFELKPGALTLDNIRELFDTPQNIQLVPTAYEAVDASYALIQDAVLNDICVYGVNTGFGLLANQKIATEDLKDLQRRLVLSHAVGVGSPLCDKTVKLILLLKINSLARGYSGVSRELINQLIALYNAGICPLIPSKGSVGASGDLAPLAHMAMTLIGEGEAFLNGERMSAKEALARVEMTPIILSEKEGLAVLNGTQVSTAIALMGFLKTQRNFAVASISGALSIEAAAGTTKFLHPLIVKAKNNQGGCVFSSVMMELLDGSGIQQAYQEKSFRVQDPYSLRCQPQVMGAIWTSLRDAGTHLINEANAVSDNPLVFLQSNEVVSGGNFHAEMTAFNADFLGIVGSEIGAIAERRIALLMDKHISGLPAFLVENSGLNSGFMIAHVTASALASENKTHAHPASVDSMPTSANQEDHVSMATFAAMKLNTIADNVLTILAVETLAACQGIDFRAPLKTSSALQYYVDSLRADVPFYNEDRDLGLDMRLSEAVISQVDYTADIRRKLFDVV